MLLNNFVFLPFLHLKFLVILGIGITLGSYLKRLYLQHIIDCLHIIIDNKRIDASGVVHNFQASSYSPERIVQTSTDTKRNNYNSQYGFYYNYLKLFNVISQ